MSKYIGQGSIVSSLASTSDAEGEKKKSLSKPRAGGAEGKSTAASGRKTSFLGGSYREALLGAPEKTFSLQRSSDISAEPDGSVESERDEVVEDILQRILLNARDRKGNGEFR